MKIALLIAVLLLAAAVAWNACKGSRNSANTATNDITYGPFTIRITARSGKTFNMNYGMVPYTNVSYAVLHKGQPVEYPGRMENNTGLPFMWKVYALPGAPDPTLIAGSQSLYMIYEKEGQPIVEPLLQQGSDFASLQFLDGDDGQPGSYREVYMEQERSSLDQLDSLQGGKLLMIGEQVVLEVPTRRLWRFHTGNAAIDNYSFPTPHGALALSPDRKQIVFRANFQSWNVADAELPDSEKALVAYDFEQDSGYCVPFDDTDTRLIRVDEIDRSWMDTYFEWARSADGAVRLQLRQLDQRPKWTGRLGDDGYYNLFPIKPGMLPVFLDFLYRRMGWSAENIVKDTYHEYTGRVINLAAGDVQLDVVFREDGQSLSFSRHLYAENSPEYQSLVRAIAEAFDAELAAGKHQEHFGRIVNETKRIRGVE